MTILSILTFLALSITVVAQAPADDSDLVAQLITANTQVQRIKDIADDSAFVFDFLKNAHGTGQGGFLVSANSATFPALLTGNGAMAVGFLGPCGANSPHTHPRATELQIIVQGGPVYVEFVMENGARVVKNTVPIGSATIFPKGSIHYQQNLACEPTIFVASFDHVDPGTSQIAQNFLGLDEGVVDATLGDIGVSVLDHLKLPPNFILGAQECLDRCKIDRSTFNFSSTFKDYAIFSNSTWDSSSVSSKYGATQLSRDIVKVPFEENPLRSVVIGLGATTAALLLAIIGLLTVTCRRRSRAKIAPSYTTGHACATTYNDSETLTSRSRSSVEKA